MHPLLVYKGRYIHGDEQGQSSVEEVDVLTDGSLSEFGNLPGLLRFRGLGLSIGYEDKDISGGNQRREAQRAHELNLD